MSTFSIQDPQSGKTVTIEGNSPPSQADAERIFSDAGLRDQPQGVLPTIGNAVKGVGNFLLNPAINIAQDAGTGIRSRMQQGDFNKNEQLAKTLESQAQMTNDPNMKASYFKQANMVRQGVMDEAGNLANSFSPDVNQNPLWRGLKGGVAIAGTADGIANAPAIARGAMNVTKNVAKPLVTAGNTVKDIVQNPLPSIGGRNVAKAADEATTAGKKILWDQGENNLQDQIKQQVMKKLGNNKAVMDSYNSLITDLTPTPGTVVGKNGLPMIGGGEFTPNQLLSTRSQLTNIHGPGLFSPPATLRQNVDLKVAQIARNIISKNLHQIAPDTLPPDKVLALYHNRMFPLAKTMGAAGMAAEILGLGGILKGGAGAAQKILTGIGIAPE